jgi:hypothetical protein
MAAPFMRTQGTVIAVGNTASPIVYTTIPGVTNVNENPNATEEIDTTALESTAKESTLGLPDFGVLQLSINWDWDQTTHATLHTLWLSAAPRTFRLTYTDGSPATTKTYTGYVQNITRDIAVNNIIKATVTIKTTGAPT